MRYGFLVVLAASASLAGCITKDGRHNDVMVFGTTTNFGLDVSAAVGCRSSGVCNLESVGAA